MVLGCLKYVLEMSGIPKKDDGEMVEDYSDYESDLDIDNVSPSE
jgi:hypothetical protein